MLWVKRIKSGKGRTLPPEWVNAILLSQRLEMSLTEVLKFELVWDELIELIPIKETLGIPIDEILKLSPVWVERLKEYCYHCKMQGVKPY
jgi:hypothetical protein